MFPKTGTPPKLSSPLASREVQGPRNLDSRKVPIPAVRANFPLEYKRLRSHDPIRLWNTTCGVIVEGLSVVRARHACSNPTVRELNDGAES
jgi:hypothetical protein